MKKNILIITNELGIWGVERALISLLSSVPTDKYIVSLMLFKVNDELLKLIPDNVSILYAPLKKNIDASLWMNSAIKWELKGKNYYNVLVLTIGYLLKKLFNNNCILRDFLFRRDDLRFDYVFNFRWPSIFTSIVSEDICISNKKYIWIHSDLFPFLTKKNIINSIKKYLKKFSYINILKYNNVFCVSREIMDKMRSVYGQTNKIVTLYNIINESEIIELWNEKWFLDNYHWIRILSVWRLVSLKGFDMACNVCKQLKNAWYEIKWYIVWCWEEEHNLKTLIKYNNVEENFILLWEKKNPYPFFKECDIYVQTSKSEWFCLSLAEAKVFGKPIVSTNFPWAKEQLEKYKYWTLVNVDENEIRVAVENIINKGCMSKKIMGTEEDRTLNGSFKDLERYL